MPTLGNSLLQRAEQMARAYVGLLRAQLLQALQVEQLGVDRIMNFTIGSGPARHHLVLELYSQGNLILTDGSYKILTLLRSHRPPQVETHIQG